MTKDDFKLEDGRRVCSLEDSWGGTNLNLAELLEFASGARIDPQSINITMQSRNDACHCHPEYIYSLVISTPDWNSPYFEPVSLDNPTDSR